MDRLPDWLQLERRARIDLAFVVVASILAVVGFRSTFAGGEELLVGVPAVLFGVAFGVVVVQRRIELLPAVAIGAVLFVLAGGVIAIRSAALFGVLPTPGVIVGLGEGLVSGWIRLLTTVPPAGEAGSLLTIPYLVGSLGAALSTIAALRLRGHWCALGPVAILLVSLLFGTERPAALLLHGIVLGGVLIGWVALRHDRRRTIHLGGGARRRVLTGGALVFGVALAAPIVGPNLPFADANPRFVLREQVTPPFDPLTEPSPLAGYRQYTGAEREDRRIAQVSGLPAGIPLRLAVLDEFDGLVWRATGRGDALAGRFSRVGERIPTTAEGVPIQVEIELLEPHGVWLPTVGIPTAVDLEDGRSQRALRVNVQTGTAAVPGGIEPRSVYRVDAVINAVPDDVELAGLPLDPRYREPDPDLPTEFVELAAELRGGAEAPYAKVAAMAEALRTDGAFSDGGPTATVLTPPGHSLARLARFLGSPQWVGNGEQYAAALGLLAQAEGIPVRVVMGFRPEGSGRTTVTGGDVEAWVEIPLDGVGWVPVDATPPQDNEPDPSIRPRPRELSPEPQPPPPPPLPEARASADDLEATETEIEDPEDSDEDEDEEAGSRSWPVALLALGTSGLVLSPLLAIVGVKRLRRFRRQHRGAARARAHGGWAEVLDLSRDLGRPVPSAATRREAAELVGVPPASGLAMTADAATFGAQHPSDDDLVALWREVDEVLAAARGARTPFERLRAAVNPASLRPRR